MSFLNNAKTRYSCRNYKSVPVDENTITTIMRAVQVAPSAVNFQPWHFIIVSSDENKKKAYEAYPREWIKTAPLLIIACGDHSVSWKRNDGKDHVDIDVSIAIDHLMLQAAELGLATCWVCNFNETILKHNFNLPDHITPVAIIPLGYPNDICDPDRHKVKRKPLEDFVHWEGFGNKKELSER